MCKLRNNKNIYNKIAKLLSCLLGVLFFTAITFAGESSWTPFNFLNRRVDSAKKNIELNSAQGKAVAKDLYTNSLKQVELLKVNPMLDSVKSTTKALNNNYLCNIKDDDIINILYASNDNFKKEIKNLTTNFERPNKENLVSSCGKLMTCVLKTNDGRTILDSVSYCKLIVNDYYLKEYESNYNIGSLSEGNKGLEVFRNKSLKDSSYDILNDVYVLAKILSDSAEEPTEILFYDMPNIGPAENVLDPYLFMVNDWYSPYYVPSGNSGENNNFNGSGNGGADGGEGGEPEGGPHVEGDLDYEITEFTQIITHEVEGKEGYEFIGNDCIEGFEIEGYDGYTYDEIITGIIMTPREAANMINNNINNMNCEYDDQCNQNSGNNNQNQDPTNEQNNLDLFGDGYNQLFDDPYVRSCFQSCNTIPCNAKTCDRLACYAKCLCLTYESPFFDPVENPGLGPVFKLKFCIQPVQEHKIMTTQKVKTIESTVNSLNILIQDLRNGGQLMLNKKTKEFLDAGLQKNNFSKQLSLSVDGFEKVPETRGSEKQKKENQVNFNTSLMESVLGFEKQETANGNGKNKYIIKGGTIEEGVVVETEPKQGLLQTGNDSEIVSSLKISHLASMGSEVSEFLQGNLSFWQGFKDAMKSMEKTAESLANKK